MFIFNRKKIKYSKILVFIGAPRSGSTLLGQIINFHPNCLISTETNLFSKIVIKPQKSEKFIKQTIAAALKQFSTGLENDKKYGGTISIYQPKWVNMKNLSKDPFFKKEIIKVVGDKKAGGATKFFFENRETVLDFLNKYDKKIYFIQIIRNPIDAAISYMKSHNIESFNLSLEQIVKKTCFGYRFARESKKPYYYLYYEDLMEQPKIQISNVIKWLDLKCNEDWLDRISRVVRKRPYDDEIRLKYFDQAYKLIKENCGNIDIYRRYNF